jgi:hypothetical protein
MSDLTVRQCEETRQAFAKELLQRLNGFEAETGLLVSSITIERKHARSAVGRRLYSNIDLLEIQVELP